MPTITRSGRPSPSATAPPALPSPRTRSGWPTAVTARCRASTRPRTPSWIASPWEPTRRAWRPAPARSGSRTPVISTISRIDPRSGRVTTIEVQDEPTELAVGAGAVWMTSSSSRTVSRLDPRSRSRRGAARGRRRRERHRLRPRSRVGRQLARRNGVADRPGDRRRDGDDPRRERAERDRRRDRDGVWVAEEFADIVDRIDPDTRASSTGSPSGAGRRASSIAGDSVWVGTRSSGTAHRGGTLRVLGTRAGFDAIDPALAYATGSVPLVGVTGDGLTALQHVAGRDGTQIVPDLAVTLPTAQDGGRTYRFVLRPDIHYSTGGVVRARDVRSSFERMWKIRQFRGFDSPGRDFFARIVGAARCTREPRPATSRAASSPSPGTTRPSRSTSPGPTPNSSTSSRSLRVHPARGDAAARRRPPARARDRAVHGGRYETGTRSC